MSVTNLSTFYTQLHLPDIQMKEISLTNMQKEYLPQQNLPGMDLKFQDQMVE